MARQSLGAQLANLRIHCAQVESELAAAQDTIRVLKHEQHKRHWAMNQNLMGHSRRAAMAQAKQEAQRLGRCVKVQFQP